MRQIQRYFRKAGRAIGRFFGRVMKGSPLDIAILVCSVGLIAAVVGIAVISLQPGSTPVSVAPPSVPQPPASTPAVSVPQSVSYDPTQNLLDETEYDGVILPESPDGGQAYLDETMFLGDSNTYRLATYGLTTWQNNLSAVGMGVQHVTSTPCMYFQGQSSPVYLARAVAMMQPLRVVVTYGTNNTGSTTQTFISQYKSAVEAILKEWPYADIIINAIPPVGSTRTGAAATQKVIDEFNKALADLARDEGWQFLNSTEALRDPSTGFAKSGYVIADGLHLSEEGAKALMEYVRTHAHRPQDDRPARKPLPTHVPTPEEMFNPQASSSSSSEQEKGVKITFSIKEGKEHGTLGGTLTQTVEPGKTCTAVTAKAADGYSIEWGCTEGSLSGSISGTGTDTQTLIFTVPSWTKLEKIEVWVSFVNRHVHTWSEWKQVDANTHERHCTDSKCPDKDKAASKQVEPHTWETANPASPTIKCTKCGATKTNPDYQQPQTHTHDWGPWQDAGDGAHCTRTCRAAGCPNPTETKNHNYLPVDSSSPTMTCGDCGATVSNPSYVPPTPPDDSSSTPTPPPDDSSSTPTPPPDDSSSTPEPPPETPSSLPGPEEPDPLPGG